jgi:hypothetical protein
MTRKALGTLATTVALAAASALPLAAGAATVTTGQSQTYILNAVTTQRFDAGEYDGVLRLTISPNGYVNGSYHDLDQGSPKNVTGGLQPDGRIWLDIGASGRLHLNGTFRNGVLHAVAQIPSADTLYFDATPAH